MIAYFIRRVVGGIVTLFLAMFVIHTLVLYAPGGFKGFLDSIITATGPGSGHGKGPVREIFSKYKLDKPWPVSYMAWLFDPGDTTDYKFQMVSGNLEV